MITSFLFYFLKPNDGIYFSYPKGIFWISGEQCTLNSCEKIFIDIFEICVSCF